jgi:hypothetical protein
VCFVLPVPVVWGMRARHYYWGKGGLMYACIYLPRMPEHEWSYAWMWSATVLERDIVGKRRDKKNVAEDGVCFLKVTNHFPGYKWRERGGALRFRFLSLGRRDVPACKTDAPNGISWECRGLKEGRLERWDISVCRWKYGLEIEWDASFSSFSPVCLLYLKRRWRLTHGKCFDRAASR